MKWNETPVWPEHDPAPEVLNTDGVEFASPSSVTSLARTGKAAGWEVRTGYSRALLRGTANSTYRMVESIGVWFGPDHDSGWRMSAIYQRFADAKEIRRFNGVTIEVVKDTAANVPGTWKWGTITIFSGFKRHEVNVTDLKEFIAVRGSVLPSWFSAIAKREADKAAKQKQAAKERPAKAKEGA